MMPLFVVPVCTWAISQIAKNILLFIQERRVTLEYLTSDGGMPSSHAAVMSSLTLSIFLEVGLEPVFFLSFFLSMIVFRDATSVRLETAKHAHIINEMLKKARTHHEALKELVGHTKRQVAVGVIVGLITTGVFYTTIF